MSSLTAHAQVVSTHSGLLAPLAVDAVLKIIDPAQENWVDLDDIKVVKKLGGTVEDTSLVEGLIFDSGASHSAGGPTRIEKARIGLIQFCLSPPKTNMDNSVVVNDYAQVP